LKSKDVDIEGSLKEEVSYGALVYNAILDVLAASKGDVRSVEVSSGVKQFVDYDRYVRCVQHLIALLEVIGDDEFRKEVDGLDEWYESEVSVIERRSRSVFYGVEDEVSEYERVKYRYGYEMFKACIRLLKRKGVIVEKLLAGVKI
jgi:hypothetical protein